MERETTTDPAYDCILLPAPLCKSHDDCDPNDPAKNYGRGGMRIRHLLHYNEYLTIQFLWSPGVYLPETQAYFQQERRFEGGGWDPLTPEAWDLGWHHRYIEPPYGTERDEWGWVDAGWPFYGSVFESCDAFPDNPSCYYDGSGLNAKPVLETLIREGDEAMWEKLKEYGEMLLERIEA